MSRAMVFFGLLGFWGGVMNKPWHQHYPVGAPKEIDPESFENINDVIETTCKKYKEKPAFSNFGHSLSFEELFKLSQDFAAFLQSQGLQKGDRIALQMPNILQYPVALFGALRAGLIVVNTNPLYTPREMVYQFKDSGCKAIVICANFASNLEEILPQTTIRTIVVTELFDMHPAPKRMLMNAAIKYLKKMVPPFQLPKAYTFRQALSHGAKQKFERTSVSNKDLAFLQYTGGTTGISKGAMLTHRNIVANMEQVAAWMSLGLEEGKEVCMTPLPLYHVFSLTVNSLAFFKYGTLNILITNPRDIGGFIKILRKNRFTIMTGVNTLFNALLNHPDFKTIDFSSLKLCVAGAMALQQSVSEKWLSSTGTPIVEGYGLTESSPVVCCNSPKGVTRVGTVGQPLPSTDLKIIKDDGSEAQIGESGVICVKGPQVMQGYWQRTDETEKVLSKDGWLQTGDIGIVSTDGFLSIQDRQKDMITVSGFKVYPNEVEAVLASHPKILEAGVIGISDPHSGEVVKAFVVKKDLTLTEEEVIKFAKENLTPYKVPKSIEFVPSLPKTNVGKILRRELRQTA